MGKSSWLLVFKVIRRNCSEWFISFYINRYDMDGTVTQVSFLLEGGGGVWVITHRYISGSSKGVKFLILSPCRLLHILNSFI